MTDVISVRFRSGCKEYYFDPKGLTIPAGTDVIVETAQGPEFAHCAAGNHQVPDDAVVKPLRSVLRIATDNDKHTAAYNRSREKEAFDVCKKKIQQHKLEMKLVRVECSFDGSKILFFFTADGRVDFRELVKDLAGVFRARIELRQILQDCWRAAAEALLVRRGKPRPDPLCAREAAALSDRLTDRQLASLADMLAQDAGECDYNVGVGQVLGAIAVRWEELL